MKLLPVTEVTSPRVLELGSSSRTSDGAAPESAATSEASGTSFGDVLDGLVGVANRADAVASAKVDALARGANDDLHGTMIAVKEADISIKLVASIRNKLLDAFNEVWKTNV